MPNELQLDFDDRLTKVNPSQYRIWHDGQMVLVKKGQSTTKPLTTELVNVNTKVYGEIQQSYFKPPLVDFTSTHVKTERFDKYYLGIWRNGEDLPYNNTLIDYHNDIGLKTIHAKIDIEFSAQEFTGYYDGFVEFNFLSGNTWVSKDLHFSNYELQELFGEFFLVTNPLASHLVQGKQFSTGKFIQDVNLPIDVIVRRSTIKNGNSTMNLQLQNIVEYPLSLNSFFIELVGGE